MSEDQGRHRFRVCPCGEARKESKVGKGLFEVADEFVWVTSQLRLLAWWPLDEQAREQFEIDLDFSKVKHRGETFYELRLDDARLRRKNLRVFFWVHDAGRTIWIVHGYWKKTETLSDSVKDRVARRVRKIKGTIQDGSMI